MRPNAHARGTFALAGMAAGMYEKIPAVSGSCPPFKFLSIYSEKH